MAAVETQSPELTIEPPHVVTRTAPITGCMQCNLSPTGYSHGETVTDCFPCSTTASFDTSDKSSRAPHHVTVTGLGPGTRSEPVTITIYHTTTVCVSTGTHVTSTGTHGHGTTSSVTSIPSSVTTSASSVSSPLSPTPVAGSASIVGPIPGPLWKLVTTSLLAHCIPVRNPFVVSVLAFSGLAFAEPLPVPMINSAQQSGQGQQGEEEDLSASKRSQEVKTKNKEKSKGKKKSKEKKKPKEKIPKRSKPKKVKGGSVIARSEAGALVSVPQLLLSGSVAAVLVQLAGPWALVSMIGFTMAESSPGFSTGPAHAIELDEDTNDIPLQPEGQSSVSSQDLLVSSPLFAIYRGGGGGRGGGGRSSSGGAGRGGTGKVGGNWGKSGKSGVGWIVGAVGQSVFFGGTNWNVADCKASHECERHYNYCEKKKEPEKVKKCMESAGLAICPRSWLLLSASVFAILVQFSGT